VSGAVTGGVGREEDAMGDRGRIALVDEFERSFLEFGDFVRALPRDLYGEVVPGDDGTVRDILGHVVVCGYGHVKYVAEHAGGKTDVEQRFADPKSIDDPETFVAAMLDVIRHARESLEGVTDEALGSRFVTGWGQDYDGEQMMEHAACHPPRHIRQIEKFLDGTLGL